MSLIAAVSAWVCVVAEDLPDDGRVACRVRKEMVGMEVLFERVADLKVSKPTATV